MYGNKLNRKHNVSGVDQSIKHSQPVQILSSSAVLECDVCKLKYYMNIYNMHKVSSGTKSKTMAVTSTGKCVDRLTEKLSFQMA